MDKNEKCKIETYFDSDGSTFIRNEYGYTWSDGVSESPGGLFCRECSQIESKNCKIRKEEEHETEQY